MLEWEALGLAIRNMAKLHDSPIGGILAVRIREVAQCSFLSPDVPQQDQEHDTEDLL